MTVATANLAQLRKELGTQGEGLLDYAPCRNVVCTSQTYDSRAVPLKLLFGHITDKYTNKMQRVWVLLYPPAKQGGYAEIQFHSCDSETETFSKHDDSNISATITTLADAFKTPKKGSKNKHGALAKYYFLNIMAKRSAQMGCQDELKIPIPITRTFVDALKAACREFEAEAKANLSDTQSQSQSATLVGDQDSDLSDAPEDVLEPGQPTTPAMVPASARSNSDAQLFEDLSKLQDEADQINHSNSDIATETAALELALQEIQERLRLLEERSRMNGEEMVKIAARREQLFKGMSAMEAFKLGGEIANKRRKLA